MLQSKKQRGLTMIELLVTLAITSIVMTGVVNVYVNSISQAKLATNLASLQESGRFALEMLSRDVRMAGYTGCLNYDTASLKGDNRVYVLYKRSFDNNALFGLIGEEWSSTGYASNSLTPMVTETQVPIGSNDSNWKNATGLKLADTYKEALANSDIIQVWTTGETGIDVSAFTTAATQVTTTVEKGHDFKAGDVMMFASCEQIIIAQICEVSDTQLTIRQGSSATCNNSFASGSGTGSKVSIADMKAADVNVANQKTGFETFSFRDAVYFVGKRDSAVNTPPALFRATNGVAREMVEGVENMQILYGVDLAHDKLRTPDNYVPADQVGNRWADVVAVRVSVLMRSFEKMSSKDSSGVNKEAYTFNFNGTPYKSDDGYLRQSYSTTISLRNRNVGDVIGLYTATTTP